MSVTNILTGRQIMERRAMFNRQFGFWFSRSASTIEYLYLNDAGENLRDSIPFAIAEQYGVDTRESVHSSMLFEVEGFKFSRLKASTENVSRFTEDCQVLIEIPGGGIAVHGLPVYLNRWSTNTYNFIHESGNSANFTCTETVMAQIMTNIPTLVRRGRDVYQNMETLRVHGPAPSLRGNEIKFYEDGTIY